jgi:DNA (cytosine-5)-methyltransferase 1
MTFPLDGFDVIHASPPCQAYAAVTAWRGSQDDHPDLVDATRERLNASGVPWVMENVPEAPLRPDLLLCGSQFGLTVRRHRIFETQPRLYTLMPPCQHTRDLLPFMHKNERAYADALGCDWMNSHEGRQAIPPAYTQHIGELLRVEVSR